jgi:hypothetical protein
VTIVWSHTVETAAGDMVCRPLTTDRFGDMETVFGDRGVARRCFCMHWRRPDGGFGDDRDNKDRFAALTETGPPPGLLGYIVAFARDGGAEVIEAYPVDGARSSVVDYFTGTLGMFDEHGFVELLRRNDTRPIVRLTVG